MKIAQNGWSVQASTDARDGNAKDAKVREELLKKAGLPLDSLAVCKQVHGSQIAVVNDFSRTLFEGYDGLITDQAGLALGIYSADCAPVFLADPQKKIVGAFHCGWRGAVQNIIGKGVDVFRKHWNSDPAHLEAAFESHIKDCCYEVGPDVHGNFQDAALRKDGNKTYLSLERAISRQLEEAGVRMKNITARADCTYCNARYHSWRRDKTEHRMISLIAKLSDGSA